MSESSFFKDLGGEIVDRASSIALIGLAGFVLLFSALGLAGFQPVEASNSVLASVNTHPAVLGEQVYQMNVVYKGTQLDLGVTPYAYDPSSGKWNYKISWNRKSGSIGNIYINGNLLYQGAYGIGEVYTGFNLNANSTYSLSYSYEDNGGRATVTRTVFKGTFKTFDGTGNTPITSSQGNTASNSASSNTNRTGSVPAYGYNTPAYGYFNLSSPTIGQTVDAGFWFNASSLNTDGVQNSYSIVVSNKAGTAVKTYYSTFQSISNNNQSFTISYWVDTSSYPNGEYVATVFILNAKGILYIAGNSPIVTIKHASTTPTDTTPSYGYMSVLSPGTNQIVDKSLVLKAVMNNTVPISGPFTLKVTNSYGQQVWIGNLPFGPISNDLKSAEVNYTLDTSSFAEGDYFVLTTVKIRDAVFMDGPYNLKISVKHYSAPSYGYGSVTTTFLMDKTDYKVGDSAYYGVQNAAPNQTIYWSSSKNGVSTGEVCSSYGQTTNSAGTWSGYGNSWTSSDVGTWNKIMYIGSCTGTAYSKTFTVK